MEQQKILLLFKDGIVDFGEDIKGLNLFRKGALIYKR